MLKADLHLHTAEDPEDRISYTAKQLIDRASVLGFEVISITNHNQVLHNKELENYAKKKNMLLIPGAEINVEGADVLVYNITHSDAAKIKRISDLRKVKKKKNTLIIAPHPYYVYKSLGKKLENNIKLFDAVEYCHFYTKITNSFNNKAANIAAENNKPLIGTSDAHELWKLNSTYTLIDSKKDPNSVIRAIKQNKIKVITSPLGIADYIKALAKSIFKGLLKQKK